MSADRPEQTTRPAVPLAALLGRLPGWNGPQGSTLRLVLALGLVGVLLLYVAGMLDPAPGPPRPGTPRERATVISAPVGGAPGAGDSGGDGSGAAAGPLAGHEQRLARELETVLGAIDGAGRVRVTVRLRSSAAQVLATESRKTSRSVQEQDAGGGTRTTTDGDESVKPVVLSVANWGDQPLTVREEAAEIDHVVVIAAGARDARVRESLYYAAAAAAPAPLHRITVLPMEGGR